MWFDLFPIFSLWFSFFMFFLLPVITLYNHPCCVSEWNKTYLITHVNIWKTKTGLMWLMRWRCQDRGAQGIEGGRQLGGADYRVCGMLRAPWSAASSPADSGAGQGNSKSNWLAARFMSSHNVKFHKDMISSFWLILTDRQTQVTT